MFTHNERQSLRSAILSAARGDPRISGGAITGSASVDQEDPWSDIDLAFGVRDSSDIDATLSDFSARMYGDHGALHHLDVPSAAWIYRVFLLSNTLQVDLAFAPAASFGAKAPTFRLVFGCAAEQLPTPPPAAEGLIGWAWLYGLHVRSAIARGKLWQAEYMVSAMRDQVLALACLRHGLPARDGRGMDALPSDITTPLRAALIGTLDAVQLTRAFLAVTEALIGETRIIDAPLAARLEHPLRELTGRPGAPT